MANSNDLEKLCLGAKAWNAWRETEPDRVLDLTDADLTLSQRQFGPSGGGPINLRGVNLTGATLRYATLSGANLEDAILAGADLVHARLDGANLTGADMTDAVCENADLADAKLDDAVLIGTSFANARNLTEDQIAFTHGDASTLLPAGIMPPSTWFAAAEDSFYSDYPEYPAPAQLVDEDLYEVLGVARTAKPDAIRVAFRHLVKKLHPDVNPNDDAAQEAFKKVSIAYRILNDPEKRVRYDAGEIGGDGEINPEFEANRQFRRHAFRFYTAAALSLLLAGGVLGVVWHAVLTDDGIGRGRVEIAVATPPKSRERLDAAQSDLKVDFRRQPTLEVPAEDAAEAKTEILGQPGRVEPPSVQDEASQAATPEQTRSDIEQGEAAKQTNAANDLPDNPVAEKPPESLPGNAAPDVAPDTVPTASQMIASAGEQATQPEPTLGAASESAASGSDAATTAGGQSPAPPSAAPPPGDAASAPAQAAPAEDAKVTMRPLFETHEGQQARPAQADAASAVASPPHAPAVAEPGSAGGPYAVRSRPARAELFMREADVRTGRSDAISALFRQRAVRQTMAHDEQQATASLDPFSSREEFDAHEEVWDLYTHSIPDAGAPPAAEWPGFAQRRQSPRPKVRAAAHDVVAKVPVQELRPAPASRNQAVSDILAGGL